MNQHTIRLTMLTLAAAFSGAAVAADPAVDGVLEDWVATPVLASDPAGDSIGPIDVTALRARSRGSHLFVQIDVANTLNLSSGAGTETTLRLIVGAGARTLTVDFRARTAYLDGNPANAVTWPAISFSALPTYAANRFEMELDLALINAGVGSNVTLAFQGADTLVAPAAFTMTDPGVTLVRRGLSRDACSTLRVVSLNTEQSGWIDAARKPQLQRLIDSVNADVYVFQEEYNSSAAQVQTAVNAADPMEDGGSWNIQKSGELAILSRHTLVPMQMGSGYFGAVVRHPAGDVLVMTTHLKCCGYSGSTEDATRISQATTGVQQFAAFRAGTGAAGLVPYKNAPALLVGDWNLVGAVTPLSMWLAAPSPAMTGTVIRHQIGDEGWTWASPGGTGFWPGVLDLAVYDASRMTLARALSLDTSELNAAELAALGLLATDSTATDHRLVVLDFLLGPNADLNRDGSVTTLDLTQLLTFFGQQAPGGSPAAIADLNADGAVNTADLTLMLAQFGRSCS